MKKVSPLQVDPRAADPTKFTGRVVQEEILSAQKEGGARVHRFSYEPGARSRWHIHEGEQAVFVLHGAGAVAGTEGVPTRIGPGDLLYLAPGERHWHGALPDEFLVHLAFTASGGIEWAEEVSTKAYQKSLRG
jgi:quercetin dioxygenase-like cupin family protein